MYELSVAFKYLIPRWRQLSVSIISLISVVVIALVVWLILVFFSVTQGLEKTWIQKLIALTGPVRITPTDHYYSSYYHLVDSVSADSNYALKTIGEKLSSMQSDPYNPEFDEELPASWPQRDTTPEGTLKDPVKLAFQAIQTLKNIPGLAVNEYEMTSATLKLRLLRPSGTSIELSQSTYLNYYAPKNRTLLSTLLPANAEDLDNFALNTRHTALAERIEKTPDKLLPSKNFLPESLASDPLVGDGVLLPKGYRQAGVLLGDRGYLSYQTATASAIQEQRIPVYVAGFYDPGILPLGGKMILANSQLVSTIRAAYPLDKSALGNGIQVYLDNFTDAPQVKKQLDEAFIALEIAPYWKIDTFREFDFTRDFLQQLRSERNLFTLISSIILIVACANIVSMLIILVNNKKMEIGILRAMGASSWSIAAIFGTCGIIMGLLGSVIGLIAAAFTLNHLEALISWISRLQGFDAFNPLFYGDVLPNEMSLEVLFFITIGTALLSLIAGVIPAIKASFMHPSAILRSE